MLFAFDRANPASHSTRFQGGPNDLQIEASRPSGNGTSCSTEFGAIQARPDAAGERRDQPLVKARVDKTITRLLACEANINDTSHCPSGLLVVEGVT
jgi:hypothetical protein